MNAWPAVAPKRFLAAAACLCMLVAGVAVGRPQAARADSQPPTPSAVDPVTVSADALPTVQINGVVWSQAVVGNTVYAGGNFTEARPAGAAPGTQETPRTDLLAYDIRTGVLDAAFNHTLNGQVMAVAASPDGSRLYIGGDFTTVDGQVRKRIAAFDTATGALVSTFRPSVSAQVRAIAATNSTVYFGGSITAVGGVSRTRMAAVRASDGSLLPWAPRPSGTANEVLALLVLPDGSQVIAGGRFAALNGVSSPGVGALDPTSGATRSYRINQALTNNGPDSAVWSLSTNGTYVFGTAYDFGGPGNFEGTFAVEPRTGETSWVAYCRGDTYSAFATNGALYVASHEHNCSYIDGFAETNPVTWHHATAFSLVATTRVHGSLFGNTNFLNVPAPKMLDWWPDMAMGTFTGQYQAGWSVTGNSQYVVYGGEFPRVNGVGQQGLVRYAMPNLAPNKIGPEASTGLTPTLAALGAGGVRLRWTATSDEDNEYLTYRVYRDGGSTPVCSVTQPSQWWTLPAVGCVDSGVPVGTHSYQVSASDPFGNTVRSSSATIAVTSGGAPRPYVAAVLGSGPSDYWPLGEKSGTTAYDYAGVSDLVAASGVGRGVPGAISGDADTAYSFNGSGDAYASTRTRIPGPNTFSVEAWFQTSSTQGGRIVGFGDAATGQSYYFDRHLYMDPSGRVLFGAKPTPAGAILQSAPGYNDGRWHHVVGSIGGGTMTLYVDGAQVASATGVSGGQNYSGYWRIGADKSWAGANTFDGRIDEVAIYPVALAADEVRNHYALGATGTASNLPPTAAFTSSSAGLTASFDGTRSTDPDGTVASYSWDFGDGATGTGAQPTHTYATAGNYQVRLTVTDNGGVTGSVTQQVTVIAPPNQAPTAAFTSAATDLTVSVDGTGSSDPDGSLAAWSWDFGDGSRATGSTAQHAYANAGTYTITLTVTDDKGATAQATRQVSVTAPVGSPALALDRFWRTVDNGLGSADIGGPWEMTWGTSRQSVTPGVAELRLDAPGNLTGSTLTGVSQTSADVQSSFSVGSAATGGGTMVYVTGRRVALDQQYRVRVRLLSDGRVGVVLTRLAGSMSESFLTPEAILPGVTYTPGTEMNVRLQVWGTGTTHLAATVWPAGSTEPGAPTVTATDTTPSLQAPGGFALAAYLSGSATSPTAVHFTSFVANVGA